MSDSEDIKSQIESDARAKQLYIMLCPQNNAELKSWKDKMKSWKEKLQHKKQTLQSF